jgi:DNA-directed RNA polymerase specialized sigma24 family protein
MAIISDTTGRWELVNPHRRIIAWRHPDNFDDTGRWHYVDLIIDRTKQPYRDDDTIDLVDDLVDSLIICRSGSSADAGAQLSIIASLTEELNARLPETIFEARNQAYTWAEIAARLAIPESTIRHRYSDYVACRKEMPDNHDLD